MRDRLIEILIKPIPELRGYDTIGESRMSIVDAENYADRLLANGVIVPRIKVGDNIYYKQRGKTISAKVFYLNVTLMEDYVRISEANATSEDGFTVEFDEDSIGKTVFLSREEAEQALKGERHG